MRLRPESQTHPTAAVVPEATLSNSFCAAFGALGFLWLPWVLLRQIDAFLAFKTPSDLMRDVAVAWIVLAVVSLVLAASAALVSRIVGALGGSAELRRSLRWSLVLVPVGWICIWQFGSASLAWLRQTTEWSVALSARGRVVMAILLAVALLLLSRRGRLVRIFARVIPTVLGLRGPALLGLVLSVGWLTIHPIRLLHSGDVAPTESALAAPPDIYLLTIDTLSAVDASVCGEGPTLMPRLRAFAAKASCFDRHYAVANFTTPSTSTMETGALPWTHWGVQIVAKMAPAMREQTLAALLRQHGYDAHSISANIMASPRHHGSFATYTTQAISPSTSLGLKPRLALTVFPDTTLPFWFAGVIPFLDTLDVYLHGEDDPFAPDLTYQAARPLLEAAKRPQFLWLHTLPPHDPYLPPPSTKYRLLPAGELDRWSQLLAMGAYPPGQQNLIDKHRLRYREAILGADEALGQFLDELERKGKLDKAIVIVTSDHGESFERGYLGHAGELLHEPVVRVPLVIKLPGQRTGRVVDTPVSLADVVPTVADLLDLPKLPSADGRSLKPALEGGTLPDQPVFTMAMERQSRFKPIKAGHYAVIDGSNKLVLHLANHRVELFDLSKDPHERQDLSASAPETTARLRSLLERRLALAEERRAAQFDPR